jgi:hypothetical protein
MKYQDSYSSAEFVKIAFEAQRGEGLSEEELDHLGIEETNEVIVGCALVLMAFQINKTDEESVRDIQEAIEELEQEVPGRGQVILHRHALAFCRNLLPRAVAYLENNTELSGEWFVATTVVVAGWDQSIFEQDNNTTFQELHSAFEPEWVNRSAFHTTEDGPLGTANRVLLGVLSFGLSELWNI